MNNDLISRSELKKAIEDHFDNLDAYFPSAFIKEVDNAPTVVYLFYQEAYQTGYEEGYAQGYIDGSTGADMKGDAE
jgi:flagellar biosynthesis/type III secretory pathway protein FliH